MVALLSSYRKRVPHFGQNPLGRGREWEATSASSYTSFSAKGKAKSARSVVCSNVEFVFTCTNCCREVGPKSLLKNSSFVSGHRFGDAVSSSKPYAPLGAGHRKPGLSANCLAAEGDCRHTKSFSAHCDSLDSRLQRRSPKKTLTKDARLKKSPASLRGRLLQPTFLLAGARQTRTLRAVARIIGDVQLPCPRAHRGWLEHHLDGAVGLGRQTRTAGRRGDAEVPGRRDHDARKRYALVVLKRKRLRQAGRPHRLGCIRRTAGCQCDRRNASAGQWHRLWAVRSVISNRNVTRAQSELGRSKGNLDDAIRSRRQRAAAGLRAGHRREVTTNRDAADVQRRASRVGECDRLPRASLAHYGLAKHQRRRRQRDRWTATT